MMPRNLDRRVEILFPVRDARIRNILVKDILQLHLRDNVKARELLPDGTWKRVVPGDGDEVIDSQERLLATRGSWNG